MDFKTDNLQTCISLLVLLSKVTDYYSAELPSVDRCQINAVIRKVFSDDKLLNDIYQFCDDEFIDLGLK